jgi:Protein of unknown function (DUF2905)
MTDLGKLLIILGLGLAVLGAIVWGLGRIGFRGLPGDIRYQGDHLRVYFPIVTCLVLSAIGTALLWLWRWFTGK